MRDAQKPDHISLNLLVDRLRAGCYVIPDFQREFEWKPWDIQNLLRSIFLDYYIGSLLLWKGNKSSFEALACEPIYGFGENGKPEHIVLDGQQRLTALYYAFMPPEKPLPTRTNRYFYFLHVDKFVEEEYDVAFDYDWTKRWEKLKDDPLTQYQEHLFPFAAVGKGGWSLANWAQGYETFWREKAEKAKSDGAISDMQQAIRHANKTKEFGDYLRSIVEHYQVSFIELDQDLEIDKVCDIFTQINSRGIQLDTFDLINALLKPKGLQLKKMWREAAPKFNFVNTGKMNVYILQVMSLLKQAYCSPKYLYFLLPGQARPLRDPDGTRHEVVLVKDVAEFKGLWATAVKALTSAVAMLRHPQEFGVISSRYLPYESILPAFAALQSHVGTLPAHRRLDAQRKLRHWYWASVFLNRYSGSVESTTARDFLDIKAWFDDDGAQPAMIAEFASRFRSIDLRKEVRYGTSMYNGIVNLLAIRGARDWMTGNVPQYDDLDDHHIIPASKASALHAGGLIHSILNRTPLTAETNRRVIHDRLPNVYVPELMKQNGEDSVREVMESHLISPAALQILLRNPFTPGDFEAFLVERQRTILDTIESLLIRQRLDLPQQLRELDERVETIELRLREYIATGLGHDYRRLPSNVAQKATERIEAAIAKDASLDPADFARLDKRLEYCDLRELQDTIQNKGLWGIFEPRFVNKEMLVKRFDQLAELRNGIRHSRSVSEITRKEGEAAILWFEEVLRRETRTT